MNHLPKVETKDVLTVSLLALAILTFCAVAQCQNVATVPTAPVHVNDGQVFHRGNDIAYGLTISTLAGFATHRPWVALLAGTAAGVANEARYGRNFNTKHLMCIEVGTIAGYGLTKLERHYAKKRAMQQPSWVGN